MSDFHARMKGTAWGVLGIHKQTVSYTAWGVEAADISAIFEEYGIQEQFSSHGTTEVATGQITCSPDSVSSPDTRDKFTIDSVTWAVDNILRTTPYVVFSVQTHDKRYIGGLKLRMST